MTASAAGFEVLKCDEVFMEGMLASDVASLWRRLARTDALRGVARSLGGEPTHIEALCRFVDALLDEPHEHSFRHPNDIAVCAGLVVLQDSPLSVVRRTFAKLRRSKRPSLVWVQRMAEYCDEHWVSTVRAASQQATDAHIPSLLLPFPLTAAEPVLSFGSPTGEPTVNFSHGRRMESRVA